MRSNKNKKMRYRKKFCGLEGFSLNPWIFKIFTHNRYCFYLSTELAKFPSNLINLGWFSHVLGTIYSNPMYNFWNSSIPCTQFIIIISSPSDWKLNSEFEFPEDRPNIFCIKWKLILSSFQICLIASPKTGLYMAIFLWIFHTIK